MELREYLNIITKRLPIILSLALFTTLSAFIYSFFFLDNVYEAATTLYAGRQIDVTGQQAYQDILMGQTLVKDYREIAKSKLVCREVKAELGKENIQNVSILNSLKLSDAAFSNKITVSLKNDTRIIEIKVSDTDPDASAIIANKVAEVFKAKAVDLLKLENVQIVDKADVPTGPVRPNKTMNVAIGLMLGLMAGLGLVFLIEYLDNTVKTPDDVLKHTGMTVLGVIPKFELANKRETD